MVERDGFSDSCSVSVLHCDDVPVVAVRGEVDMCTASLVATELVTQVNRRPVAVVVDLSAVSFFDSTGINVLLEVYGRALNRKVAIQVIATRPSILKALQITGVDQIFAIHAELPEALRAVTPIPGNASASARS